MAHETDASTASPTDVLVAGHRDFLAFIERRVHDRALAEDILQAAFVRGLERIDQVRDDESVVAWFYRLLRNAIVDHHRRTGTATRGKERMATMNDVAEIAPDDREAVCACLGPLAAALPADQAQAIRRVDLEGAAVKDFAAEVGITANNAGVRLFRARENLRRAVARCCGTCAEHGCADCTCDGNADESTASVRA
jgi:RNA polymerase sigma factor (sigma-70 family)